MNIAIELKNSFGRLAQREPFLICDNPTRLTFETDYVLKDAFVVLKNATATQKLRLADISDGFELPREFVTAGELNVSITLMRRGKAVKTWQVEPIVFTESDLGFTGLPEFERVLSELAVLTEVVKEQQSIIAELADKVAAMDSTLADVDAIVNDALE